MKRLNSLFCSVAYHVLEGVADIKQRQQMMTLLTRQLERQEIPCIFISTGCELIAKPDPALFALEPEDIHFVSLFRN